MAEKTETEKVFDLSGKTALVTAAAQGFGRAFCEVLAEFGANVAFADLNVEGARETAEIVKKYGGRAIAIEANVAKQDQVEAMVSETLSEFGSIDILFSNAGIGNDIKPLHEQTLDHWYEVMDVNLTSMFLCMRAVLPIMQKQKQGSIICTSSIAGLSTQGMSPQFAPYGVSKAGVSMLVRYAAREYAPDGIRINAIAPGLHRTPSGAAYTDSAGITQELLKHYPMGRWAEQDEIKGVALFLASSASSFMTGQTLASDGGCSA